MFKIIKIFPFPTALELEKKILGDDTEIVEIESTTEEEIIANCQDADAIVCSYEPITSRVIDALPKLKLIAFKTIGFDSADINYAKTKNIPVTNIRHYCTKDVAEYVVGMMLALNKRIIQFNKSTHIDKEWKYDLFPEIRRIDEQIVGLIGFGNIPKLITERLKPFNIKVIAYDPFVDVSKANKEYGVEIVSLENVLSNSDIISLHLPANEATKNIINAKTITKMKDGVILINSARGPIVDEDDILKAVDSGKVGYYATDVVNGEYPDMNTHPFSKRENIILTPHIAFYSKEALNDADIECAEILKNFIDGNYEKCNIVNGVSLET